MLTQTNKIT